MYKVSGIDDYVKNITSGPTQGLRTAIYKKVIKPDEEKKEVSVKNRLIRAGLTGMLTGGLGYGMSALYHKRIPMKYLIPASLSTATAAYFFPEHRNAVIDYHKHKDDKILKEDLKKYIMKEDDISNRSKGVVSSIKNIHEMSKQSSVLPFLGKAVGSVAGAAGKVGGGFFKGLTPVAKTAPFSHKVRGIASKGIALTGLGIGAYKGYQHVTRPTSEGNYTTFLRNNILSGNINANEITDRDKSQINDLGMR